MANDLTMTFKVEDKITPTLERMTALIELIPPHVRVKFKQLQAEDLIRARVEGLTYYVEPSELALETLAELECLVGQ